MYKTILFLAFFFVSSVSLFAQQQEQTLFNNARVRGGFAGPIFSWSRVDGKTGYGVGGGAGVVFDRVFVGLFGMGETFDAVNVGSDQLALGYGGLWLGYTYPSYKLVHLYGSVKIAGGGVGVTDFDDDWDWEDDWNNAVFVAIPEAGLELNVARWLRLSGSVGYRFVGGFDGWGSYDKNDLNAPVFNLTMRLGWFGGGRR